MYCLSHHKVKEVTEHAMIPGETYWYMHKECADKWRRREQEAKEEEQYMQKLETAKYVKGNQTIEITYDKTTPDKIVIGWSIITSHKEDQSLSIF